MSEPCEHTPEPWKEEPPDGFMLQILDSTGICILRGGDQSGDYSTRNKQIELDLRRAKACVNACVGLTDPELQLKLLRGAFWALKQILGSLPAKRDWLDPSVEVLAQTVMRDLLNKETPDI